jgi:hypothetical protein
MVAAAKRSAKRCPAPKGAGCRLWKGPLGWGPKLSLRGGQGFEYAAKRPPLRHEPPVPKMRSASRKEVDDEAKKINLRIRRDTTTSRLHHK